MGVKVKDIYDKVRTGEVSKYHFMGWLGMYGFKYKERGFEQGWKACQETEVKALKNPIMQAIAQAFNEPVKPLTEHELFELWKSVNKIMFRQAHIDFARALEERYGIK